MQTRVFITHGYTAHGRKHWFPWLKARLERQGLRVKVLNMPDSYHPTPQAWLAHHQAEIPDIRPTDIFIGHSLGCIATLRFLAQQHRSIGGLLLISGFDRHLPDLPELDPFTAELPDYAQLIADIPQRVVIASMDDCVVDPDFTERLAVSLRAEYITTNGYGHFIDRHGVTELPLVYDEVMKMVTAKL